MGILSDKMSEQDGITSRGTQAPLKRKNKPGAGRPRVGRTANLPRIRPEYYADLKAIAERRGQTIARTLEGMIADDAWMTGGTK